MAHRLSPEDLESIEGKMAEIIKGKHPFIREEISRDQALALFEGRKETYKVEAIHSIPGDAPLTLYRSGEFVDLCRGPHVEHTGKVVAYKLTRIAGAYWRGDETRPMLQRIYGTAFPDKKQLRLYLQQIEEAKKRDHRKLGRELGLFAFDPVAPASPFFTGRGSVVYNRLQEYVRGLILSNGYEEVITPQVFDMDLFRTSGHYEHYKDNMFACEIDDRESVSYTHLRAHET